MGQLNRPKCPLRGAHFWFSSSFAVFPPLPVYLEHVLMLGAFFSQCAAAAPPTRAPNSKSHNIQRQEVRFQRCNLRSGSLNSPHARLSARGLQRCTFLTCSSVFTVVAVSRRLRMCLSFNFQKNNLLYVKTSWLTILEMNVFWRNRVKVIKYLAIPSVQGCAKTAVPPHSCCIHVKIICLTA